MLISLTEHLRSKDGQSSHSKAGGWKGEGGRWAGGQPGNATLYYMFMTKVKKCDIYSVSTLNHGFVTFAVH